MKNIYDADRLERLERALLVIEGLTYLEESTRGTDDEGNYIFNTYATIYRIAHNATGHCDSCRSLDDIEKWEKELKKLNVINVEKILIGQPNTLPQELKVL